MTRLVDDLLDLGRINHNQLTVHRDPVDLAEVIRAALETVGPSLEEQGHELLVVMPDRQLIVDGDGNRLAQVFANLFANACNFTSRFGSIEVRGVRDSEMAVVTVKDSGDGIAPELMPHVFEMFRQAHDVPAHERSGLGVGLALVKKIVELHGGLVGVHSDGPGTGCTFTVRLPLHVPQQSDGESGEPVAHHSPEGTRILIVDDDVDTADALAALLRLHGSAVRTAYTGEMALEMGGVFEPQVVLLDVSMPGMDGHATCRAIRAEEWGEGAHIIAVTGWGQDEDRARTRESGFDHHLLKPVDPAVLSTLPGGLEPRRQTPWPELKKPLRGRDSVHP